MFWEDLVFAAKRFDPDSTERSEPAILKAAEWARGLCDANGLVVMALQPFINYDGLLDEGKHAEQIVKLKLWFKVVKILGTDLIQVPSQVRVLLVRTLRSPFLLLTCVPFSSDLEDEPRRYDGRRGQDRGRHQGDRGARVEGGSSRTIRLRGPRLGRSPRLVRFVSMRSFPRLRRDNIDFCHSSCRALGGSKYGRLSRGWTYRTSVQVSLFLYRRSEGQEFRKLRWRLISPLQFWTPTR